MRLAYLVGLTVLPALYLPLFELPISPKAIATTTQISQTTPDALLREGERLMYQGQYAAALTQLEAAVEQAQATGDQALQADAWTMIAMVHHQGNRIII